MLRYGEDSVVDACRWERVPSVRPLNAEPDPEVAEVGRFPFARRGRHIHLDVSVRLDQYRLLLEAWATREASDWGEED